MGKTTPNNTLQLAKKLSAYETAEKRYSSRRTPKYTVDNTSEYVSRKYYTTSKARKSNSRSNYLESRCTMRGARTSCMEGRLEGADTSERYSTRSVAQSLRNSKAGRSTKETSRETYSLTARYRETA